MATNMQAQEDPLGWTKQKLMELVDTYRVRPCLYDNTSPDYHNRDERARSWIEIAEAMGREEDEIRAKMKSIRTQYARIIQKGQHPKCKTGHTVSSWWLLPTLSFLDDFIIPRKADSDTVKDNELLELSRVSQVRDLSKIYSEENSLENGDLSVSDMIYDNMAPEPDLPQAQTNSTIVNTEQPSELDGHSPVPEPSPYQSPYISTRAISRPMMAPYRSASRARARKPLKRVRRDQDTHISSPATSAALKSPDVPESDNKMLLKTVLAFAERSTRDDDEDSVFGRYVGNEMRSVTDLQSKRIAKMRIQKVLFEAQTGWTETSNEGIYHAPRDGNNSHDGFPAGVVCNTNNTRVV